MQRVLVAAVALGTAAAVCTPVFSQTADPPAPARSALIDVPYLPQGEDLCGGAAAAMVMRYWGARDVHADAFAPLVDRSAGGIRTSALEEDLRQRGWTAIAGSGDATQLARELARGRPVIALIEDRPGRYHYVVVIGLAGEQILLHDPARFPSHAVDVRKFDDAWRTTDRWMLILLPAQKPGSDLDFRRGGEESAAATGHERAESATSRRESRSDPGEVAACAVDQGVRLANDGDYGGARRALETATAACPDDAAPWRELAGLDALDGRWDAAAAHARRAVEIDPSDAHGWRELATAEYMQHHDLAALEAWNQIGQPAIDLVDVKGLRFTRYQPIADAIGLAPGAVLTADLLRRAERRAREVPSIALARVTFHPVENGRAQIDASVVERERAPTTYPSWLAMGLGAAANRELTTSVASPTGGGDLIAASWRWWPHRPMIAASYSAPGSRALGGGLWRIDASRETQTFGSRGFEETRTRAAFGVGEWITGRTRVSGNAALESWTDRPQTPALSAAVEFWPVQEHLALDAGATKWRGFGAADAAFRWRSRAASAGVVWLATSGYRFASSAAPESIWPGADTGHARDVLLRAHPLLNDGSIAGGVFGRRLTFGTAEVQRWSTVGKWPIRIAPAAFIDAARATRGTDGSLTRAQIDAGAGVRVSVLGMGVLRIDVAHGLRDGRTAMSIGWER